MFELKKWAKSCAHEWRFWPRFFLNQIFRKNRNVTYSREYQNTYFLWNTTSSLAWSIYQAIIYVSLRVKAAKWKGNFTYDPIFVVHLTINTSVRLIKYAESAADSEITQTDMKILKAVSKTPNDPPMVPKIFRVYTSPLIEISMDYDFHRIIEYHI